ncbi:Hypothetical predicted protein [Pelobates cultripes]|uniref:Uncharacterized protein n=1 Tax=Pelobates cultripes TaxID=61616 RepID=A0AAD1RKH4_PELCU|nr:Hypothetical predicted protein [Pelobates cultripes]
MYLAPLLLLQSSKHLSYFSSIPLSPRISSPTLIKFWVDGRAERESHTTLHYTFLQSCRHFLLSAPISCKLQLFTSATRVSGGGMPSHIPPSITCFSSPAGTLHFQLRFPVNSNFFHQRYSGFGRRDAESHTAQHCTAYHTSPGARRRSHSRPT